MILVPGMRSPVNGQICVHIDEPFLSFFLSRRGDSVPYSRTFIVLVMGYASKWEHTLSTLSTPECSSFPKENLLPPPFNSIPTVVPFFKNFTQPLIT